MDEDGVDIVEAIDAWIDDQIDDLGDDELERVLVMLDAISASRFANLDAGRIDESDIDAIVELAGGSVESRAHCEAVLRAALLNEPIDGQLLNTTAPGKRDSWPVGGDAATPNEGGRSGSGGDVFSALIGEPLTRGMFFDTDDDGDRVAGATREAHKPDTFKADDLEPASVSQPAIFRSDEAKTEASEPPPAGSDREVRAVVDDSAELGLRWTDHPEPDKLELRWADDDDEDDDPADDLDDAYDEYEDDDDLDDEYDDDENDDDLDDAYDEYDDEDYDDEDDEDDDDYYDTYDDDDLDDAYDEDDQDDDHDDADYEDEDYDDDPYDGERDENFLTDIVRAQRTDEVAVVDLATRPLGLLGIPAWATTVEPVPLRENDDLGPSFLPEPVGPPPQRRYRLRHVIMPLVMVVGLVAFGFGMYQLVDSLDEEPAATASSETSSADTTDGAETAAAAASTPEPAATAVPDTPPAADASVPIEEVGPVLEPPAPFAIRLVTGDVMIASHDTADGPPVLTRVYDAGGDGFAPARELAWGPAGLVVADNDGNVLIIDPAAERDPRIVFEATDELGEAVEIAALLDQIAVRTDLGNIVLVSNDADADPTAVELVWDAVDQGALATDISAVENLLPFVLDTGDARMVVTGPEQIIVTIWLANNQPPVFNVEASPSGILLGVGQGAIARYRLGEVEGDRFETVWDPFSTDEVPAIGYSGVGTRTAIVLGDGAIVLVDDTGTGPRLWDPAETEIRAFIAVGSEEQIVVLLETGSVVRIPVASDLPIESIWDITDETLRAANQIVLQRTRGG